MMRTKLALTLLVAALGSACSDGGTTTPTSPTTPTTSAPGPQTPTNPSCLPAAPGNFRVTVNGSTRVFNWNAVSGVQDYFIQVGDSSGAKNLIDTNTTQTTYNWTGAGPSTYFARVYARNSCGSGPNSTELTFN